MAEYSNKIVAAYAGVHPITMTRRITKLIVDKKFKRKYRGSLTPDEVVKLAELLGFKSRLPDELKK